MPGNAPAHLFEPFLPSGDQTLTGEADHLRALHAEELTGALVGGQNPAVAVQRQQTLPGGIQILPAGMEGHDILLAEGGNEQPAFNRMPITCACSTTSTTCKSWKGTWFAPWSACCPGSPISSLPIIRDGTSPVPARLTFRMFSLPSTGWATLAGSVPSTGPQVLPRRLWAGSGPVVDRRHRRHPLTRS